MKYFERVNFAARSCSAGTLTSQCNLPLASILLFAIDFVIIKKTVASCMPNIQQSDEAKGSHESYWTEMTRLLFCSLVLHCAPCRSHRSFDNFAQEVTGHSWSWTAGGTTLGPYFCSTVVAVVVLVVVPLLLASSNLSTGTGAFRVTCAVVPVLLLPGTISYYLYLGAPTALLVLVLVTEVGPHAMPCRAGCAGTPGVMMSAALHSRES
jgi:hypothetical protein